MTDGPVIFVAFPNLLLPIILLPPMTTHPIRLLDSKSNVALEIDMDDLAVSSSLLDLVPIENLEIGAANRRQ